MSELYKRTNQGHYYEVSGHALDPVVEIESTVRNRVIAESALDRPQQIMSSTIFICAPPEFEIQRARNCSDPLDNSIHQHGLSRK